jgi:hypothetical protein
VKRETVLKGHKGTFWSDRNVLYLTLGDAAKFYYQNT